MSNRQKVNILLVDDQPAKLLALETILSGLNENLIRASSAEEALRFLLSNDIAVVLVDVCMPGMDGFELAEMIRSHPRYNRTAIIFISAVHLSDADRLRGYDLGAVDYIPVPIIPEVLRAKVSVFSDLHRKTEELRNLNQELERRVAERTADLEASGAQLRASEHRFQQIAHAIDEVFWLAEVKPRQTMLYVSPAWERIWGRSAASAVGGPGAWLAAVHPDDRPKLERHLAGVAEMAAGTTWDLTYRIVRPDGELRWIHERARVVKPAAGEGQGPSEVLHAAGLAADVTERRAAGEERDRLLAILEATPDLIATADAQERTRYLNPAARRALGIEAGGGSELPPVRSLFPPDVVRRVGGNGGSDQGLGVWEGESVLHRGDGRTVPLSQVVIAHRNEAGQIDLFSTVARDITERKRAEEVLSRDRETLERLVAERTEALAQSNERLRLADRMAMIGTLSAGLGHDMGNLLLPVRMRLAAIEAAPLPADVREDIAAIKKASDYLQRLARSLRLLSIDPYTEEVDTAETDLEEWWSEAEGMLRNGISVPTALVGDVQSGLPPVRIGKAGLTQIAFNLVQNAGDALRSREDGQVCVRLARDGHHIVLSVVDNGPGMDQTMVRRCTEPFFTTKTRGMSTGLGLALVSGLVQRAGGRFEITSELGRGSAFHVSLPVAIRSVSPAPASSGGPPGPPRAIVSIGDVRCRAVIESVLRSLAFAVANVEPGGALPTEAELWVLDRWDARAKDSATQFAAANPLARIYVIARADPEPGSSVTHFDPSLRTSELCAALREAILRQPRLQESPA